MIDGKPVDRSEIKKKIQETLLAVSEKRPHHLVVACIDDAGQVMVAKYGGDAGLEALMGFAVQTMIIDQCRKNLGM